MKIIQTNKFAQCIRHKQADALMDSNVMTPENEDLLLNELLSKKGRLKPVGRDKMRRDISKKNPYMDTSNWEKFPEMVEQRGQEDTKRLEDLFDDKLRMLREKEKSQRFQLAKSEKDIK